MSVKVVFLGSAETDLKDLRNYIVKNFGKETWQASYSAIKEHVAVIQSFPEGGKIPDELVSLTLAQYLQIISGMPPSSMKSAATQPIFTSFAIPEKTSKTSSWGLAKISVNSYHKPMGYKESQTPSKFRI